jgi:hypothetical protein
MRAVADRIGSAEPFTAAPIETLERLKVLFETALLTNTLDNLPRIAWDRLPAVLWYGDEPHLVEDARIVTGLEKHIARYPNARGIRSLLGTYVREFRPRNDAFETFATLARNTVATHPERAGSSWVDADSQLALFDPAAAPGRIAGKLLDDDLDVRDIPIPGWTPAGRLGTTALLALLAYIRGHITDRAITARDRGAVLESLKAWVDSNRGGISPSLDLRIVLADSLLTPFVNQRAPGENLRKCIVDLVLKHVGDPRTVVAPWQLPELASARSVLTSWLSLRTIEEFCVIIDETAEQGHWQDRRKFWAWYAERSFVSDAWVAYGPKAARRARAKGATTVAFGQLTEARDPAHSILLMKIGSLIIAEFSHNGSCRFYPAGTWQPTFYEKDYSDYALRDRAESAIAHHQGWETRFASSIRNQTGVRSDFEYQYR